jgi:hypothetical protein
MGEILRPGCGRKFQILTNALGWLAWAEANVGACELERHGGGAFRLKRFELNEGDRREYTALGSDF